jgi:hypothetical protein
MTQPPEPHPLDHPCSSRWQCWLNSLATPGGNLFLLCSLLLLFIPTMILLMVAFGPGSPVVITIVTITSGFAGAITTRMNDSGGARHQNERANDQSKLR